MNDGENSNSSQLGGREFRALLSKARHDLRSPLCHILGFNEILQEEAEAASRPDLIPLFEEIGEMASNMVREVGETLELNRILACEA